MCQSLASPTHGQQGPAPHTARFLCSPACPHLPPEHKAGAMRPDESRHHQWAMVPSADSEAGLFCHTTFLLTKGWGGLWGNHRCNYTLPSSCRPSSRTAPSKAPPCSHLFATELSPGSVSPLKQKPRGAPSLHKYVDISELGGPSWRITAASSYCGTQAVACNEEAERGLTGELVWRKPFRNKRFLPWQRV